jgi:hypothetical protein
MKSFPRVTTSCCFALFLLLVLGGTGALAQSIYFTSQGCAGCHGAPAIASCNGCHAHGTHPDLAKNTINVAGTTDKGSYAPGEMVTVTITGGYLTGWLRVVLYDQNMVELARSSGNDSGMGGAANYPATLRAPAPATPGTFAWKVAWYGNQVDALGATFGPSWTPDVNNPNHGAEIVAITTPFTVARATLPKSTKRSVVADTSAPESSPQRR